LIKDAGPEVKSKASTKFIERITKLPATKGLSEKKTKP
jgi:hypothetical protein